MHNFPSSAKVAGLIIVAIATCSHGAEKAPDPVWVTRFPRILLIEIERVASTTFPDAGTRQLETYTRIERSLKSDPRQPPEPNNHKVILCQWLLGHGLRPCAPWSGHEIVAGRRYLILARDADSVASS